MTTRELADKLRLGTSPVMTARDAMAAGDEISALLNGPGIQWPPALAAQSDKVRGVLVANGAIDATDFITDPFDILAVLLPPNLEPQL